MPRTAAMLLPTEDDLRLADKVNARLPAGARVDFFRVDAGDDGERYGVVYQYHTARHVYERSYQFFEPDAIVHDVKDWIAALDRRQRYVPMSKWEDM